MSQDTNLWKAIDKDDSTQVHHAAFKGLKIVNFESTKLAAKRDLYLIVSHRFGSVKYGFDDFFGLDNAVTRIQFVYGISDVFNISISRSSYQKVYDLALKHRLKSQAENGFPVTVVGYIITSFNTSLDEEVINQVSTNNKLSYVLQILVSRKFNENFTLELAPSYLYEGYVFYEPQDQSQYILGLGGRYKLGKRWSINMDYGLHLNRATESPYKNPLSIGVDIETGGHVFQLHFTNAQPMTESGFLSQGTGSWEDGDFYFGFNLTRIF